MPKQPTDNHRRSFLKLALSSAAVLPLHNLIARASHAQEQEMPKLEEDDPVAKGLNYHHDASAVKDAKRQEDAFCHNCRFIQSEEGEWRPCSVFPGKLVAAEGWCSAWIIKG